MTHFVTQCIHYIRRLDTHLPVLLFACLLSWQNTVAVGAADWAVQPELVAADGQLLSTADFCNRGDVATGGNHCVKCIAAEAASLGMWRTVVALPHYIQRLPSYFFYETLLLSLYKGSNALLRGPPDA